MSSQPVIKRIMLLVLILVIIGIVGYAYLLHSKPNLGKSIRIPTENQPMMGNPNAKIRMVVFEDLKCGNCARFNNETLPQIKREYINTQVANYTMINLAFIPNSMPVAVAARCVYEQNPAFFFPFVDAIYENQPPESEDWANLPQLSKFAQEIRGLNQDAFMTCLIKSPYNAFIENNMTIAKNAMGDQVGTPALYINGILIRPLTMDNIHQVMKELQ